MDAVAVTITELHAYVRGARLFRSPSTFSTHFSHQVNLRTAACASDTERKQCSTGCCGALDVIVTYRVRPELYIKRAHHQRSIKSLLLSRRPSQTLQLQSLEILLGDDVRKCTRTAKARYHLAALPPTLKESGLGSHQRGILGVRRSVCKCMRLSWSSGVHTYFFCSTSPSKPRALFRISTSIFLHYFLCH